MYALYCTAHAVVLCAVCCVLCAPYAPYGTNTPQIAENYCGSLDPSAEPVKKTGNAIAKIRKSQNHPPKSETETWTDEELNCDQGSDTGENFVVEVELHYHRVSGTFDPSRCILIFIDAISSAIIMAASFSIDKSIFRF